MARKKAAKKDVKTIEIIIAIGVVIFIFLLIGVLTMKPAAEPEGLVVEGEIVKKTVSTGGGSGILDQKESISVKIGAEAESGGIVVTSSEGVEPGSIVAQGPEERSVSGTSLSSAWSDFQVSPG